MFGFGPICTKKWDLSRNCCIGVTKPFSVMGPTFIIYKWEVDAFMTGNKRLEGFQQLVPKSMEG